MRKQVHDDVILSLVSMTSPGPPEVRELICISNSASCGDPPFVVPTGSPSSAGSLAATTASSRPLATAVFLPRPKHAGHLLQRGARPDVFMVGQMEGRHVEISPSVKSLFTCILSFLSIFLLNKQQNYTLELNAGFCI